jgi:Asp-tRNA(Asn)/Glu-tRNA(Gln) amidotransferase A subunit family amidase
MLSALDLARRIESGEMTPAGVLDLCAKAISAHEEAVGAFAACDVEQMRRTAEREGRALTASPLRGLPVGVKDIFDTTDFPTEYGSPIYAGHRPAVDAALVATVRRAGGLVLGKTVTTEFAYFHPGRTRNPHALEHTPGGSSSGSAAAIAAGMLPLAIASQTGGSTIRPAAFCGVAALKPSFGLLPTKAMKGMVHSLDTAGVMAAGVADVAFALGAICGRDYRVDTAPPAVRRLALARTKGWSEASVPMQQAVEMAARAAEAAGAQVVEIALPPICERAYEAHSIIQGYEASRAMAFEYENHRDQLSPVLRESIEAGAAVSATAYKDGLHVAEEAREAFAELVKDADGLLTASALGAAPKGLGSIGTSQFNRLWTLLGTPCVNVPGLFDESGLPLGVQIVSRFGADQQALRTAYFLERAIFRRR